MAKDIENKIKESLKSFNIKKDDIVLLTTSLTFEEVTIEEAVIVVKVLKDYLQKEGALIMDLSGKNIKRKDIFEERNFQLLEVFRKNRPAYSKKLASLYADDALAIALSLERDAVFSKHFSQPYIGVGALAKLVLSNQSIDFPNGNMSPLARLYELRAKAVSYDEDIRKFKLNNFIFESSDQFLIKVNGGSVKEEENLIFKSYLEKVSSKKQIEKLVSDKNYKKLFLFKEFMDKDLLAVDVRDYIDYCRNFMLGD